MVVFPIQSLMDYDSCYNYLVKLLHPKGLHCPCGQHLSTGQRPHKYRDNGLPCFKCRSCGKVFNIFTDTILSGIHYDCVIIVLLQRGLAQGTTTLHLTQLGKRCRLE